MTGFTGPKKEPIHNGPKSEKQEHGTKAVKTRGSNLQVLISGWQFVGEPSNKRMYCRHPVSHFIFINFFTRRNTRSLLLVLRMDFDTAAVF